jgi:hypothetical protein
MRREGGGERLDGRRGRDLHAAPLTFKIYPLTIHPPISSWYLSAKKKKMLLLSSSCLLNFFHNSSFAGNWHGKTGRI